jgi:sRNA-binding protein
MRGRLRAALARSGSLSTWRYHFGMAASATTRVEIDTNLLDRLRKRRPEQNDRELLESAARIQLGREAIARVRKRFAGVPMEEIEREAVKAVREVRRERAAERRAAG